MISNYRFKSAGTPKASGRVGAGVLGDARRVKVASQLGLGGAHQREAGRKQFELEPKWKWMLHGVRKGMSMDGITYITRGCGIFRNASARSSSKGKWTQSVPSM